MTYRTNYSNGFIVYFEQSCFDSWLLLPGENLWPNGIRGSLYVLAMIYVFLGVAIASDVFMCCIEVITSKKTTVSRWDPERQEKVQIDVYVWNETVANLTLLALGSSAPEVLLAVIETVSNLGETSSPGEDLGPFTIIGSASYNLFLITAICIWSVPSPASKRIQAFGVFLLTALWSLCAYVWLLVVIEWSSPKEIEVWEAAVTLSFFPIFVLSAWCLDKGCWINSARSRVVNVDTTSNEEECVIGVISSIASQGKACEQLSTEMANLDSLSKKKLTFSDRDLQEVSRSRERIRGIVNYWRHQMPSDTKTGESVMSALKKIKEDSTSFRKNSCFSRTRFRHMAMKALIGAKKDKECRYEERSSSLKPKLSLLVTAIMLTKQKLEHPETDQAFGSFSFSSHSYSVLTREKVVNLEVNLKTSAKDKEMKIIRDAKRRNPYNPETRIISDQPTGTAEYGNISGTSPNFQSSHHQWVNRHGRREIQSPIDSDENDDNEGNAADILYTVSVEYETRDGTAQHGVNYDQQNGILTFSPKEFKKTISVSVIDNEGFVEGKEFFVILKNPSKSTCLCDPNLAKVTITDDKESGEFSFEQASYHADFVKRNVTAKIVRRKGCDGVVAVHYNTLDGTAKGGSILDVELRKCDYQSISDGKLVFQHGETSKSITLKVNTEAAQVNKNFLMVLKDPSPGATISPRCATVVNIANDVDAIVDRVATALTSKDDSAFVASWKEQFEEAMSPGDDEDGAWIFAYVMHFLTFFWKVIMAFIPPRSMYGGWPAFFSSLAVIGVLTAVIEQLGKLLSCVLNLKTSVAGITIIAIGTSLPDTFASRTAALHDTNADAAIGNITGSNSVNVFLGLGIPWLIRSIYHSVKGTSCIVEDGSLAFSVTVFTGCGGAAILLLAVRRFIFKGELGGPKSFQFLSAGFMVGLWLIYVLLVSFKAYDYI